MLLGEIKSLLENELSPKAYLVNSEVYGLHYGQTNKKKNIRKVMLTIDLNLESIQYAIKNKINLIITLHGLVTKPIKNFNLNLINKLSLLSKYPISIFVLNSSFIAAEGGISDTIMEALYLKLESIFEIKNYSGYSIPIGRICIPKMYLSNEKSLKLIELLKRMKSNLNMKKISYVGNLNTTLKTICIVGGNFSKIKYIRRAIKFGCDCYISGRIDYSVANFAKDLGISLIEIAYYKAELIALKKIYNYLSLQFPYDEFFFFDSKNPLKVYNQHVFD